MEPDDSKEPLSFRSELVSTTTTKYTQYFFLNFAPYIYWCIFLNLHIFLFIKINK